MICTTMTPRRRPISATNASPYIQPRKLNLGTADMVGLNRFTRCIAPAAALAIMAAAAVVPLNSAAADEWRHHRQWGGGNGWYGGGYRGDGWRHREWNRGWNGGWSGSVGIYGYGAPSYYYAPPPPVYYAPPPPVYYGPPPTYYYPPPAYAAPPGFSMQFAVPFE
jgi:hypothetical protein